VRAQASTYSPALDDMLQMGPVPQKVNRVGGDATLIQAVQ